MSDLKRYSIKDLAEVLGCSITAIQKKISVDKNNSKIKRFKQRYQVIIDAGKSYILLSDEDILEEKRLSKGFKNVSNNVSETCQNVVDVDYEVQNQSSSASFKDDLIELTNGFMQRYETLQNKFYNVLIENQNQVKLLTDSESETQRNFFESQAKLKELELKQDKLEQENIELKKCNVSYKRLNVLIYVLTGFILIFILVYLFRYFTV